jgi:hypothetical protein
MCLRTEDVRTAVLNESSRMAPPMDYNVSNAGRARKTFNVLTGTPVAHLHQRGKWLEQATVIRDGLSLTQAMQRLNVARTTALRWRHRFLAAPKTVQAHVLNGVAEADETFFLESFKDKKQGRVHAPRKRGGKASKRGLSDEQIPVLMGRDRTGNTTDFVFDKADKAHICAALKPVLSSDCILCTDSGKARVAAAREMGITHHRINRAAGIRVVSKVYHVQNVNAYDSRLPTQNLDATIPWCGYALPTQLSWRAPSD